jgi:hypothetical protein
MLTRLEVETEASKELRCCVAELKGQITDCDSPLEHRFLREFIPAGKAKAANARLYCGVHYIIEKSHVAIDLLQLIGENIELLEWGLDHAHEELKGHQFAQTQLTKNDQHAPQKQDPHGQQKTRGCANKLCKGVG